MTIISLKPGRFVYCGGKKLKILKAVDHSKVLLQDVENGETQLARISELSARKPDQPAPTILIEDLAGNIREAALKRLEIIKPLLVSGRTRAMVEQRATESGVNTATLYRWIQSYERTMSLVCLAPGFNERGGKGKSRLVPEVETIIAGVIEDEYLQNQKKSPQEVYEIVKQICRRVGLYPTATSDGHRCPSGS